MSIRIFPATDLHLLNGTSVLLRCFATPGGIWTDLSTIAGFNIQFDPMPAFATQAGLRITATSVGSAVTRARLIGVGGATVPIRLSVHRELRRLFLPLPQNTLVLETDRDDRVLTVYGEFKAADGSTITEDITAHPYLRYQVKATSGSPNLAVSPAGRVTSGNAAGTCEIGISVDPALNQPASAATISVTIVAAVMDRPILIRFHTGSAIRKKSILFLPDGFTSTQQAEFEMLASNLGRKLLQTISPYRHLRESFDLYTAFVPSAEEGVTIGPPIVMRPGSADVGFSLPMDQPLQGGAVSLTDLLFHLGHPATSAATTLATARTQLAASIAASMGVNVTAQQLPQLLPQALYDLWQSLRTWPPQSRVRETFFGIMMDDRHCGTLAIQEDVPTPPKPPLDAAIHLSREAVRYPVFDERRLPDLTATDPKTAHLAALSRFVKTLRAPGGVASLGSIWASSPGGGTPAGDSFGLIVIIARADHYGGIRREGCLLLSIGSGIIHHAQASVVVPRLLEVVPVPRPISAAHRKLGFAERSLDSLVSLVAHELAHAPPLGDLNDEYGDKSHGTPNPANRQDATFVEKSPNTQLIANTLSGGGPGLNVAQIKWNLERVEGAARIETLRAAGPEIEIGVNTEDALRWPALPAGRLLTLRSENLAGPAPGSKHVGDKPANPAPQSLNLVSFDISSQAIRCTVLGTATPAQVVAAFPAGSVIIVPRLFAGATVRVIPAALAAQLAATGPFSPSTAPCTPAAVVAPPNVAGFAWPRNQLQAVAAYEVGASFNCGVIRPTGECKMRSLDDQPTDFCYACKYAMVYAIDPALLPVVDLEYP